MKSLQDYLTESEYRATHPVAGDNFSFELDDGTVVDTYIMEACTNEIIVDANEATWAAMEQWMSFESVLAEDCNCEAELEYEFVSEGAVKHMMHKDAERMSRAEFVDKYGTEHGEFWDNINAELSEDQGAGEVMVKAADEAPVDTMEAEYQGRKVTLNKPTRGDQKKFKVYVRDPKTGNVKKVNFGHGGKTAKRLGQKTMKIKKSNPARRKSFRARHNCANPGPRTGARYWACRSW
jgi:hypothetical protein